MTDGVLSADVVVDFLLDADAAHHLATALESATTGRAKLWIDSVTISESCRMLELVEPVLPPESIADALTRFLMLPGIQCPERDALLNALESYARTNKSFPEAWWSLQAQTMKADVMAREETEKLDGEVVDA